LQFKPTLKILSVMCEVYRLVTREIMLAVLDGKTPPPSRKQEKDIQAVILAGCQSGTMARWLARARQLSGD
jgi:hypothetical protein